MPAIPFDNSYARLPANFYSHTPPTPVAKPGLIQFNRRLAESLGLEGLDPQAPETLAMFAGNYIPEGAEPIAMAYAGHQFGGFSPQLGDGRAILLGEVVSPAGVRHDIQLKGSGPTPWSRGGDGRSALGPVLREYLVSEAMARLGVPTTRALAAVTTGEEVARNTLVPGGILTRIATGFVRVGTFEYFFRRGEQDAVRELADYVIERHYSRDCSKDCSESGEAENRYQALLEVVIEGQAALIAKWMQLGFIHGVMNTDNMSIAAETIDYGPCAFMDGFSFNRVYSSIDRQGRYAYQNQPQIGQWNLVRLAESLLGLLHKDETQAVTVARQLLNRFGERYTHHWLAGMRRKLGLERALEEDAALIGSLLQQMDAAQADFTLLFHHLSYMEMDHARALFARDDEFDAWTERWFERQKQEQNSEVERQELMQSVNPVYIPRNHQIEAAIRAAEDQGDFSVFAELREVLDEPFTEQAGKARFRLPPKPEEEVLQTFCGT